MIRLVCAVLLWCMGLCSVAAAQSFPSLHRVTGVASDDVLNIRASASASADIIGTLPPGQAGIEVMTTAKGWGLVNIDERSGWVSMRFMKQMMPEVWPPKVFRCFGTEPFWSGLAISAKHGRVIRFELPGEPWIEARLRERTSRNDSRRISGRFTKAETTFTGHYVLSRQLCTDGMSDRTYGLMSDFLIRRDNRWTHYSGCCSLKLN